MITCFFSFSISWLWSEQDSAGCFYSKSTCDLSVASHASHSTALTAYIAAAMVKAGVPGNVRQGINFLHLKGAFSEVVKM